MKVPPDDHDVSLVGRGKDRMNGHPVLTRLVLQRSVSIKSEHQEHSLDSMDLVSCSGTQLRPKWALLPFRGNAAHQKYEAFPARPVLSAVDSIGSRI